MGVENCEGGWADRDTKVLCLIVSVFSGLAGLSTYGSGDPFADAAAIIAALLASLATAMATVADPPPAAKEV